MDGMGCIFLASTPRCGSTYLSNLLQNTRCVGVTQEYALRSDRSHWHDFHRFESHKEYFSSLHGLHSTSNGVISLKLMWSQMQGLLSDVREYAGLLESDLGVLQKYFGLIKFIYLRRMCPLAQGISLARARGTGVWAVEGGKDDEASSSEERYSAPAIYAALRDVALQTEAWTKFFLINRIVPYTVCYEELVERPEETVRTLLKWVGITACIPIDTRVRFVRQADGTSEEWRERFIEEEVKSKGFGLWAI